MEKKPKLNEKYMLFLDCLSSFEGSSYENSEEQPPVPLFLVVLH